MLDHELLIRSGVSLSFLVAMASWELLAPCRITLLGRLRRWPSNLAIAALGTVLVRLLLPMAAVGVALTAQGRGWGLLHFLGLPGWLPVLISLLLLDLAIYGQHVVLHKVPMLWRLHRMHHADLEFDVTTGVRFHPLEILLSMLIKMGLVVLIGVPAHAVLLFEIGLNATSLFNHGNVRLPDALERALRWLVVTPDMHRVHHSVVPAETNSNFGFNLPWWDRIFHTYRAAPAAGHTHMTIGLAQFREVRELRLDRLLLQPFRADDGAEPSSAPIRRN